VKDGCARGSTTSTAKARTETLPPLRRHRQAIPLEGYDALMKKAVMQSVMRNIDLSVGARLLWWELVQWTTDDLPECYPPQHALVEALGVSRASVIRWTRELEAADIISITRGRRGNRYTLKTGVGLHASTGNVAL